MSDHHAVRKPAGQIFRTGSVTLLCALAISCFAQQPLSTLIVGVDHRSTTSLNGDWHYLVDRPPAQSE